MYETLFLALWLNSLRVKSINSINQINLVIVKTTKYVYEKNFYVLSFCQSVSAH